MMPHRFSCALTLIVAFTMVGCGKAEAEGAPPLVAEPPPAPPTFWPTSPRAPYPASFAPPVAVPGGRVHLGDRLYDYDQREFRPVACNVEAELRYHPTTQLATVASFTLMTTEVTARMYKACVTDSACAAPDGALDPQVDGRWDSPAREDRPVAVSYELAQSFCQTYGGDVPTEGQYLRATEADDGGLSIRRLSRLFVHCRQGEADPLCAELELAADSKLAPGRRRGGPPNLRPSAFTSWDVGPFGHRDLFANAFEWVRASDLGLPKSAGPCDPVQEDLAYVQPPTHRFLRNVAFHTAWKLDLTASFSGPAIPDQQTGLWPFTVFHDDEVGVRPQEGFRCAFPRGMER